MLAKLPSLLFVASLVNGRLLQRATAGSGTAAAANVIFDGRLAANATQADFDGTNGPFGNQFVKGQNESFSKLILLPQVKASVFDVATNSKALEVTIDDQSIFVPGNAASAQTAVRRTELNPRSDLVANNISTTGVKTLHFSLMPSAQRPLNTSHEYSLVFLERADFAANVFVLKTGTLLGSDGSSKNDLVLLENTGKGTNTLFQTPFTAGVLTNMALQLDFDANTLQVFSSTGNNALKQQTQPLANDLSVAGQYHFGVNKNPVNPGADVLRSGFQESGILEGVVYAGIFIEDTKGGAVTLS